MLGQYLRDVEAGLLSEDEQLTIDDSVRMLGSPVFLDLAGTTAARSVLEAMITHSDNIATDIATGKVGADRVRALIAQAGLRSIRIPDTTRRFLSYIFGAPAGVDLGWPGILQAATKPPGSPRSPLNGVITLAGSARDRVLVRAGPARGVLRQAGDAHRVQAPPGHVRADRQGGATGHARLRQGRGAAVARPQHQELRGADRGRRQEAHAGDVLLHRELGPARE